MFFLIIIIIFFLNLAWTSVKGKTGKHRFEQSLTVSFTEPETFSQKRVDMRMALELLHERDAAGLETELKSLGAFFEVMWMCK